MNSGKIVVLETGLRILELEVPNRDVAEYFRAIPAGQREQAAVHVVRVGVFCLERARVGHDLEFGELPSADQLARADLDATSTDRTDAPPSGVAGHPAHEPIPLLGAAAAPPRPNVEEPHQT